LEGVQTMSRDLEKFIGALIGAGILIYVSYLIFGELSKTSQLSSWFFYVMLGLMILAVIVEVYRFITKGHY